MRDTDFREILADSSRKIADIAASYVLEEPARIRNLVDLILADEYPHSSRAARVLSICSEKFPEIIDKHQNQIFSAIPKINSEGVIRNLLKIVADYPVKLTAKNKGVLTGLCFDWLSDISKPVAIRVHAMQLLFKISLNEKGIKPELISILEEQYADGSMGFRSRADRILKKLYRN
jgi:hypothetical protein